MTSDEEVVRYALLYSPPERLRLVLERATTGEYSQLPSGRALASGIGLLPTEDVAAWYGAFAKLSDLVALAETYVQVRLDEYTGSAHEKVFRDLRRTLQGLRVETAMNMYAPQLAPILDYGLKFVITATGGPMETAKVETTVLDGVIEDVRSVIVRLRESELSERFKVSLVLRMQDLLFSLESHLYGGEEGIEFAATAAATCVVVHREEAKSHIEIVKDAMDIVDKALTIVLKASAVYALLSHGGFGLLNAGTES